MKNLQWERTWVHFVKCRKSSMLNVAKGWAMTAINEETTGKEER